MDELHELVCGMCGEGTDGNTVYENDGHCPHCGASEEEANWDRDN
jgi:rubrerythrin